MTGGAPAGYRPRIGASKGKGGDRHPLSYANVVSTLCLFILLGGGAYAASERLGRNSVGPRELKRGAVRTAQLGSRAVTLRKLNRGAIRRLRGARGAQGLQGPPGPPGGAGGVGSGVVGPDNLSSSIPSVRVTHSLPQPIEPAGGISDPLQFDEERWDTAAMHGPATNTRLTAPVAGVYLITANIEWSGEDFPEAVNGSRTVVLMPQPQRRDRPGADRRKRLRRHRRTPAGTPEHRPGPRHPGAAAPRRLRRGARPSQPERRTDDLLLFEIGHPRARAPSSR